MRGTLSRMGFGPVDLAIEEVDGNLALIDQSRILVPIGTDNKGFLVLPDQLDRANALRAGLKYELRRVPAPGLKDKTLASGFFRPDGIYALPMKSEGGTPFASRIIARWKDLAGGVHATERRLDSVIAPLTPPPLPEATLAQQEQWDLRESWEPLVLKDLREFQV